MYPPVNSMPRLMPATMKTITETSSSAAEMPKAHQHRPEKLSRPMKLKRYSLPRMNI
jgi:hypothetical protein